MGIMEKKMELTTMGYILGCWEHEWKLVQWAIRWDDGKVNGNYYV